MSLGNLHNPKAAAKLIDDFRRRFSAKVCMAPHADHAGGTVAAHTMSLQAVLRKISTEGHVYAPQLMGRFSADEHPIQIRRLGLRDVSVFNGFCAKHDAALFSCLENQAFSFSREQLFMLAYRAAARECYLKRKQCESLPELDAIRDIHGIDTPLTYSEETLIHQAASLRGAEEAEAFKAKLDRHLLQRSWDRLVSHAILFEQRPTLAACFVFQPFHDMNGTQLQDYEDLQAEMSQLVVSVLPLEQGGAAIFSWLDSANSAPRRFFESVLDTKDITSAVIHAALDNSENFAMAPDWYEHLPEATRSYLFSRIAILEASITYFSAGRPEASAPDLGHWGQSTVSAF